MFANTCQQHSEELLKKNSIFHKLVNIMDRAMEIRDLFGQIFVFYNTVAVIDVILRKRFNEIYRKTLTAFCDVSQ